MNKRSILLVLPLFLLLSNRASAMQDFYLQKEDTVVPIAHHNVSPFLQSLSPKQWKQYAEIGNRIKAIQLDNGDYRIQEEGGLKGGGGLLAALAVTGTLVVGGVATLGATAGALVTAGPLAAGAAAVLGTKATCAAAVYVAIVTAVAPTP